MSSTNDEDKTAGISSGCEGTDKEHQGEFCTCNLFWLTRMITSRKTLESIFVVA